MSGGWTGFVTRTKKVTKTKKKDPLPDLPFFCKNGLGVHQTLRLPGKHQGLPFEPQIEPDSLSLFIIGSNMSI